jgi:hypothetical protein
MTRVHFHWVWRKLKEQKKLCFFKPNDNWPIISIVLGAHVLGSKTWDKKRLIAYKIENEILVMKKHCEVEHFDIFKKIVIGIVRQHFIKTNAFEEQSSKVWKVVILRSIF